MINFDLKTYRENIIGDSEFIKYETKLNDLTNYFDRHKDMTGWARPKNLKNAELINDINKTSAYIRSNCDVFLVVGIGGSYLGSKAVIEALNPYFYNRVRTPEIYFVGNSLSSEYLTSIKELIKNKQVIINYISKSGTTYESDVTFRILFEQMQEKYSEEELKSRIIFTTGNKEKLDPAYKAYEIPSDIGGRYSVLSPVGLLPIAVASININELLDGAIDSQKNGAMQMRYAIIRDVMQKKGKIVEAYVAYEPKLASLIEWLKQLYAESLGKDGGGILPIGLINTTDLHSLGQYLQEGRHNIFETVLNIKNVEHDLEVDGKSLNEINNIASSATSIAHNNTNILNNIINIDKLDAYHLGYLMQFFMISCAMSGFLENVDAFNQPGVEEYKRIMKELLNKKNG